VLSYIFSKLRREDVAHECRIPHPGGPGPDGHQVGRTHPPPLWSGSLAPSTFTWAIFAIALGYVSATSPLGRLFEGQVRALVPLFDTEVGGIEALRRLGESLFAQGPPL